MRRLLWLSFLSCREQFSQVRIDGKTRLDRIKGGIGMHGCLASTKSSLPQTSPGGFHWSTMASKKRWNSSTP